MKDANSHVHRRLHEHLTRGRYGLSGVTVDMQKKSAFS